MGCVSKLRKVEGISMPILEWGKKKPINDYCEIFAQIACPHDEELRQKIFLAKKFEMITFRPELMKKQLEARRLNDLKKFKKLCMNAEFMKEYYSCLASFRTAGFIVKYLRTMDELQGKADELGSRHLKEPGLHKAYHIFGKRLEHHKNENSWKLPYTKKKLSSLRNLMKEYQNHLHLCAAWVSVTSKAQVRTSNTLVVQLKAVEKLSADYLEFCVGYKQKRKKTTGDPDVDLLITEENAFVLSSGRNPKGLKTLLKKVSRRYSRQIIVEALQDYKPLKG